MSEAYLTVDEWPFKEAKKRAELLFYHRKIEVFLEAAWLILKDFQKRASA
jgi:hypothetical protein